LRHVQDLFLLKEINCKFKTKAEKMLRARWLGFGGKEFYSESILENFLKKKFNVIEKTARNQS